MDSIESIRARWTSRRQGHTYHELLTRIRAAGTDNLSFFGCGYEREGGYSLQQQPEEFAALTCALMDYVPSMVSIRYLEIGSASGGVCRFLQESLGFDHVTVMDDHGHHRWTEQAAHFGAVKDMLSPRRWHEYIGDSHALAAAEFLRGCQADDPDGVETLLYDVAFIDGDHTYAGVTADIALVTPFLEPGALCVLHDIVACEGVKRAWQEAPWDKLAELIGTERPLGIGIGRIRG